MIIYVTGKLGSGKSTAVEFLRKEGCAVISADKIGHDILDKEDVKRKLLAAFGKDILDDTRKVSRPKLASIAFKSKNGIRKLNAITHPKIKSIIAKRTSGNGMYVVEAALYKELRPGKDHIVVQVKASDAEVKKRIKNKGLLRRRAYQNNIKNPKFIIDNNGTMAHLKQEVDIVWHKINKKKLGKMSA